MSPKYQKSKRVKTAEQKFHKDFAGTQFEFLTVLSIVKRDQSHTYWKCKCKCGNTTVVTKNSLRRGASKSCGCRIGEVAKKTHFTHGMSRTPVYKVWAAMKDRCVNNKNPGYPNYGGRGISFDSKWNTFESFYRDMYKNYKIGLSLERKDVNGMYSKSNCLWATAKQQASNKRNTIRITFNNEATSLTALAKKLGIPKTTALYRYQQGWALEKIFKEKLNTLDKIAWHETA